MEDFLKGMLDFLSFMATEGLEGKMEMQESGTLIDLLQEVWKWIGMTAVGLSLIYFLTEVNQKLAFEGRDVTFKSILAPFTKLAISLALFSQTGKIAGMCIKIYNAGIVAMKTAIDGIRPPSTSLEDAITAVTGGGFFSGLLIVIMICIICIIAVLVQFVINFLWDVKVFTFKIEFIWRLSTAPFALADVYSDKNSQAFRFIKSMFALILAGMSMLVLPVMAQAVVGDSMSTLLTKSVKEDMSGIRDGLTIVRAIFEVALLPSFLALNTVSVAKQAIKEGLS